MYRSTNRLPSLETPPTWPQSSWPAAPSASRPTSGPSAWSCGRSAGYRKGVCLGWRGGAEVRARNGESEGRGSGGGRKNWTDRQTETETEIQRWLLIILFILGSLSFSISVLLFFFQFCIMLVIFQRNLVYYLSASGLDIISLNFKFLNFFKQ